MIIKFTKKQHDDIRKAIHSDVKKTAPSPPKDLLLSTGSTLLNLALSDEVDGGFVPGKYYFLVGDSASGKTFFSMGCFAEAARSNAFKNHRFLYDNVEDGMLMDVERLFGTEVDRRLSPPGGSREAPVFSETIEDFYYHLDDAVKKGKPFIYVLDSMDGLSSEAEGAKFEEQKKAYRAGKETSGSYGDGKAKKNSASLRKMLAGLRKTDSFLIIVSQTRDALNSMGYGPKKNFSGGHALKFYATCQIWTSVVGTIDKLVRGKKRKIGSKIQIQTKKNRITGKLHTVETAIYPSYGIDDVGSCIDFLTSEKWWTKSGGVIHAKELDVKGTRADLISMCDGAGSHHTKLRQAVSACWISIDKACRLERKAKYE